MSEETSNELNEYVPEVDDIMDELTDDSSNTSPLESVTESYQPNVNQQKIIAELTPGNYDNLTKVLNILNKDSGSDTISIKESTITQSNSDCIVQADMTSILKNKNDETVDLDIINPKRYLKLLEQFRSNNNVFIINDDENSRFTLTNGEVKLFLPKNDNVLEQEVETFDISNGETICQKQIDKDMRKIIKNLAKDQDYIDFLIQDNELKAIHVPDTAIYTFPDFKTDEKAQNLDETNADLALRCSNFLPVEADNYDLYIVKTGDEKYISITDCRIGGKIDVRVSESLELSTGGNLFF